MRVRGFIDLRVERPGSWEWIDSLPGLQEIDFSPPAAGPEIELTFCMRSREDGPSSDQVINELCQNVERVTGRTVLARRWRQPTVGRR